MYGRWYSLKQYNSVIDNWRQHTLDVLPNSDGWNMNLN